MYVGRFAPSPTGSLHLGSLLAAVGSFIDARSRGGRWLVRVEDLDRARVVPGSADEILRTLVAFGLLWDGEVEYQSRRSHLYSQALQSLRAGGFTFECSCSRRELTGEGEAPADRQERSTTPSVSRGGPEAARPGEPPETPSSRECVASGNGRVTAEHPATMAGSSESRTAYPGTCREGPRRPGDTATRFRIEETATVAFDDRFQGPIALAMGELGDVIVRRRDGVFAYQLAVVVDDAEQGITDVVRGADLLESTGWQMALQRALRLPTPRYAHLPLLLERSGEKLAKSRRSAALDAERKGAELSSVLELLGLAPPGELTGAAPAAILEWATDCWNGQPLPLAREVILA